MGSKGPKWLLKQGNDRNQFLSQAGTKKPLEAQLHLPHQCLTPAQDLPPKVADIGATSNLQLGSTLTLGPPREAGATGAH